MDYDNIIVGGRVAGAILTTRLSQLGYRVLLLEKATFPSHTLSTSFFRAPALRVFEKMGVLDEVTSAAPPLRTLWNYIDGHVLSDPVEAPEEHLRFFLCERRITLDWILFPADGNLTMVALSLPIDQFRAFKKEPLRQLQAQLESLPLLASRLAKAEIASEIYGAGNIPCYQRLPYGPGWALVGDAQQVLDPWSGMGIDHGATHADFLAKALDRWLKEEATWETAMNDYHIQARAWSRKQYRRTSTFAADFRSMTRAALQKRGLGCLKSP
jgi:flavin-dependent dehydrogenase